MPPVCPSYALSFMSTPRSDGDRQTIRRPSLRPANSVLLIGTTTWHVTQGLLLLPPPPPGRRRRRRVNEGAEAVTLLDGVLLFFVGEASDVPETVLNVSSRIISMLANRYVRPGKPDL